MPRTCWRIECSGTLEINFTSSWCRVQLASARLHLSDKNGPRRPSLIKLIQATEFLVKGCMQLHGLSCSEALLESIQALCSYTETCSPPLSTARFPGLLPTPQQSTVGGQTLIWGQA